MTTTEWMPDIVEPDSADVPMFRVEDGLKRFERKSL